MLLSYKDWKEVSNIITIFINIIDTLFNGFNTIPIIQNINVVIDSVCSAGSDSPTIIGSIYNLSFYQFMSTILAMFVTLFA